MPENRKKLPLFERFPDLEGNIPWIELSPLNTPVKQLNNLEKRLKINSLWVKCDDKTSPQYGGNKVRKFEFVLADAIDKGFKKVLTAGGIGSNHCVANAIFCNQLKLKPMAFLIDQPVTSYVRNNLLLDLYFKNEIIYSKDQKNLPKSEEIYYMPPGASNPLGTLGFVNAMLELKDQINSGELPEPHHIFVACGSSGTTAGLLLGANIAQLKTKIHSIQTSTPNYSSLIVIKKIAKQTRELIAKYDKNLPEISLENLIFNKNYFGGIYGIPTKEGLESIKIAKETENIKLEPTYTGKAFAALLGFVRENKEEIKDKTILFWNTYNSRDFSEIVAQMDYRNLPKELHWVFEKPLPDNTP